MKQPVLSDLLLQEVQPAWSRDTVPLDPAAGVLARGVVLAATDGVYAPVAADATANAAAVLI
ncbi:MAG: hypothetical protein LBI31_01560, partial [Zoogloeaceae bacterium]|nr:hypothetical protein [Zoogloeaceae bacterium]